MGDINFLYQFSVQFFLDLYKAVLSDEGVRGGAKEPKDRLDKLTEKLFLLLFQHCCQSLMSSDYLAFALRLLQVRLEGMDNAELDHLEVELLLKTGGLAGMSPSTDKPPSGILSTTQENRLRELTTHTTFKKIFSHMNSNKDAWTKFIRTPSHEVGSAGKLPIPQGIWDDRWPSSLESTPGISQQLYIFCLGVTVATRSAARRRRSFGS